MNRFSSIFSQLLQLFPRMEFQELVTITQAERRAKGFPCWNQFVSMLFCQLGRAHSLHEITGGLRSCERKLKHLGITAPSHSTLAYANEHRPWELYQHVFIKLFERRRIQVKIGRRKFRFNGIQGNWFGSEGGHHGGNLEKDSLQQEFLVYCPFLITIRWMFHPPLPWGWKRRYELGGVFFVRPQFKRPSRLYPFRRAPQSRLRSAQEVGSRI